MERGFVRELYRSLGDGDDSRPVIRVIRKSLMRDSVGDDLRRSLFHCGFELGS